MNLYEFEGKLILQKHGINTPQSMVVNATTTQSQTLSALNNISSSKFVVKAQLLSTNRQSMGGIKLANTANDAILAADLLLNKEFDGIKPQSVLIEQFVDIQQEFFISFTFSTDTRSIVMLYSEDGGSGVETRKTHKYQISVINPTFPTISIPKDILKQLFHIFTAEDLRVLEINPLVKTKNNKWIALDSKITLDDDAQFRHIDRNFEQRTLFGRKPTKREILAKKINEQDHRGSAGATYLDLSGDIGIMASGGGASIIIMDTLLANNLKPANYTEYSGNPTRKKVKDLANVVLSHKLKALLIVGGNANFTDIYETLMGIMDAVIEHDPIPNYPIIIRRGGPRWEEAFNEIEQLKQKHNLNVHLFGPTTPMTYAVTHLVNLLNKRNQQ